MGDYIGLATSTMSAAVSGITDVITEFYPVVIPIVLGLGIFFWVKRMAGGAMRGSTHL